MTPPNHKSITDDPKRIKGAILILKSAADLAAVKNVPQVAKIIDEAIRLLKPGK